MTHPLRTRAARAKLHVAMLAVLPPDADAFAEAIAWAETDSIGDLGTLFSLADAIDNHVCQITHHSDCQHAVLDADALRAEYGAPTVNLALKLAGIHSRLRGRKVIWTDAPDCEPTVPITLPATILEDWTRV